MGKRTETTCPKCGGLSWYEQHENDIVQKCLCGLHRFVAIQQADGTIIRRTIPKTEVTLPKRQSKLFETLAILAAYYPARLSTGELSKVTGHSVTDTASELSVLTHKALVEKMEERKGLPGGSIWALTHTGAKLLRLMR